MIYNLTQKKTQTFFQKIWYSQLRSFLTLPARVSEITSVDFAGPLEYKIECGKGVTTK